MFDPKRPALSPSSLAQRLPPRKRESGFGAAMRIAKLGELAAIALVATICLCYAVMSRAQPADGYDSALDARTVTKCPGTSGAHHECR